MLSPEDCILKALFTLLGHAVELSLHGLLTRERGIASRTDRSIREEIALEVELNIRVS